jgi:hypothetical protein
MNMEQLQLLQQNMLHRQEGIAFWSGVVSILALAFTLFFMVFVMVMLWQIRNQLRGGGAAVKANPFTPVPAAPVAKSIFETARSAKNDDAKYMPQS